MRTRFAPTPSGYLHQGNLANALLNSWLAEQSQGEMVLRIDADDEVRTRRKYTEYIFESLRFFGLNYVTFNPDPQIRHAYLKSQLTRIPEELLFACECSRSSLLDHPCTCRKQGLIWQPGVNVLRLHLNENLTSDIDGSTYKLNDEFGDVILWRRDDVPAYHWANVIDDRDLHITHIIRGSDLHASSALHVHIAHLIGAKNLAAANYRHHSLILDTDGKKLSKSQQSHATPTALDATFMSDVHTAAVMLAGELNINVS